MLAVVGLGVATYLTVEHWRGSLPDCSVVNGCEKVLTSKYAAVGPVPTAAFGVAYYLTVVVLGILYLGSGNPAAMRLVGWLALIGFMVSLYLVYLQIWVIEAICLYCMASALICTLLFAVDLVVWKRYLRVRATAVEIAVDKIA
jgi:uncharacterized membrane protein